MGRHQTMRTTNQQNILTTGQVAKICHVAPRTVSKWFDTGRLRGYRIPGSRDRRIPRQQLLAFMRAHGIPLEDLEKSNCSVLIVDMGLTPAMRRDLAALDRYSIHIAANKFEAGVQAQQLRPHLVVLEAEPIAEAVAICRFIRRTHGLEATKVVLTGPTSAMAHQDSRLFDDFLPAPYSAEQLIQLVERSTNLIT